MPIDKTTYALRQLIPKSYHFDGYNELNCPNLSGKPFFSSNVIQMGSYNLTTNLESTDVLLLNFSNICPLGEITFETYRLTLSEFISKLKKALTSSSDFITFTIIPKYNHSTDNYCLLDKKCASESLDCRQFLHKKPSKVMAAVSFNLSDVKEALASFHEITTIGGNNMKPKNNFFGMKFELGPSKDPTIKSTMMGVSVKNTNNGNWYVFDPVAGTRKNMAGMKFGDFPVILLPSKNLSVGDLIKLDGKYHYVAEVGTSKTIKLIGAADGEVREVYPEESFIPGFNMYTKVMAFDLKTLTDPVSKEGLGSNILAAICMMQWANGGDDAEFSLDNISDDSFNGLGAFLPMLLASKDGNLSNIFTNPDGTPNLPMMLMLGNSTGNSNSNQMMQMMLITQLLGEKNPLTAAMSVSPTTVQSTKVVCEKCGTTFDDADTAFCTKCGGKTHPVVPARTTCRNCKALLREGAAFCHMCGTKVAPDTCPICNAPYEFGDMFCSKCGSSLALKPAGDLPEEAK